MSFRELRLRRRRRPPVRPRVQSRTPVQQRTPVLSRTQLKPHRPHRPHRPSRREIDANRQELRFKCSLIICILLCSQSFPCAEVLGPGEWGMNRVFWEVQWQFGIRTETDLETYQSYPTSEDIWGVHRCPTCRGIRTGHCRGLNTGGQCQSRLQSRFRKEKSDIRMERFTWFYKFEVHTAAEPVCETTSFHIWFWSNYGIEQAFQAQGIYVKEHKYKMTRWYETKCTKARDEPLKSHGSVQRLSTFPWSSCGRRIIVDIVTWNQVPLRCDGTWLCCQTQSSHSPGVVEQVEQAESAKGLGRWLPLQAKNKRQGRSMA